MKAKPVTVTLIGAGSLAHALGPALKSAGYKIDAIVHRHNQASRKRAAALAKKLKTKSLSLDQVIPASQIIWLCHTDDSLAETARLLAQQPGWKNKIVLHSSGALTSDVLAPLQAVGAHTASLHPMMTFVLGTTPRFADVPFAVEGDRRAMAAARQIVKALKAEIFEIRKEAKVLYHALGSFSSPMIVATLVTAERVGTAAGLTRKQLRTIMRPILLQTLENYLKGGPAAAFSGPIKRGDINTIHRHLQNLKDVPGATEVYRALVKSALMDLPSAHKEELLSLVNDSVGL